MNSVEGSVEILVEEEQTGPDERRVEKINFCGNVSDLEKNRKFIFYFFLHIIPSFSLSTPLSLSLL